MKKIFDPAAFEPSVFHGDDIDQKKQYTDRNKRIENFMRPATYYFMTLIKNKQYKKHLKTKKRTKLGLWLNWD